MSHKCLTWVYQRSCINWLALFNVQCPVSFHCVEFSTSWFLSCDSWVARAVTWAKQKQQRGRESNCYHWPLTIDWSLLEWRKVICCYPHDKCQLPVARWQVTHKVSNIVTPIVSKSHSVKRCLVCPFSSGSTSGTFFFFFFHQGSFIWPCGQFNYAIEVQLIDQEKEGRETKETL